MGEVENGPGDVTLGASDRVAASAAVRARLRVASSDEDALIVAFAETALGLAERVVGQVLIARELGQAVTGTGAWQRLSAQPVRAITAVTAPGGAALAAVPAIDIDDAGLGWVRLPPGVRAQVAYRAGLAEEWATLPSALAQGAAMLAAHLFDDRTGQAPIPAAVTALWRPYRVIRLDTERRAVGA